MPEHSDRERSSHRPKRAQWLSFQKRWLANLRRELLGTDEDFGNPFFEEPAEAVQLLPDLPKHCREKRTLVLDLDETLVHSEFHETQGWLTHLRSGTDEFLSVLAPHYEIIVFTTSLRDYAEPILHQLDRHELITRALFRESALSLKGVYVKDLSRLNRDLGRTIIIDNSPEAYVLQPENAIPIKPFFGDLDDTSLVDVLPLLLRIVDQDVPDVRSVLKKCHMKGRFHAKPRDIRASLDPSSSSADGSLEESACLSPETLSRRKIKHPQQLCPPPSEPRDVPQRQPITRTLSGSLGVAASAPMPRLVDSLAERDPAPELIGGMARLMSEPRAANGDTIRVEDNSLVLHRSSNSQILKQMSPPHCIGMMPHQQ